MIRPDIAELFAELTGYAEHDEALYAHASQRRRVADYVKAWKQANPERARAHARKYKRKWRKRNPELYRAEKQRYRDKHRTKVRVADRRRQAAHRTRKRTARAA